MSGQSGGSRSTGPRISTGPRPPAPGPRLTVAQPATPPTIVQLGGDRMLTEAREIDLAQLAPDPEQPRKVMNPERLAELSASIVAHGLLQPIVVRQVGLNEHGDMRYVIVAGGRRYAAINLALAQTSDEAARARLTRVRVIINDSEAAERRVLQLIENLQRENLSPLEEARSLKEIARIEGLSTVGLAKRVHRSQGYIDERLRLLRHEEVEAAIESGLLTKSAAAAVASIAAPEERQEWIDRARRGEVVRPREVYASKPNRRGRKRGPTPSGADPAALAAIHRRAIELREVEPELNREEAFHLAAVEARESGQLDAATTARVVAPPSQQEMPAAVVEVAVPEDVDQQVDGRSVREIAAEVVTISQVRQTIEAAQALKLRLDTLPTIPDAQLRQQLSTELVTLARAMQGALGRLARPVVEGEG